MAAKLAGMVAAHGPDLAAAGPKEEPGVPSAADVRSAAGAEWMADNVMHRRFEPGAVLYGALSLDLDLHYSIFHLCAIAACAHCSFAAVHPHFQLQERERRLQMSGDEAFAARARMSRWGTRHGWEQQRIVTVWGRWMRSCKAVWRLNNVRAAVFSPFHRRSADVPLSDDPGSAAERTAAGPPSSSGAGGPKGLTLAEKLLKKMGWREGEGLGRNKQGIATPLIAQKRGDRAGVIVNAPDLTTGGGLGAAPESAGDREVRCLLKPARVTGHKAW